MADIDDVMDKLEAVLDKIADNKEKIDEVKVDVNTSRSVQRYCHHCGGDGNKVIDEGTGSCPECGGDGYRKFARITLTSEE
jgi:DnaJ-class molecular chaperone